VKNFTVISFRQQKERRPGGVSQNGRDEEPNAAEINKEETGDGKETAKKVKNR